MEENTTVETTTVEQPNETAPVVEETKPITKNELLRELSKEHGINLFEPEGLKKFKEFQDSQKTEYEKAQEVINEYKTKETEWQSKQLEYESKLKASELGIASDRLEDALKLADGNPDNLVKVLEKYPNFKSTSGVTIGVQDPSTNSAPTGNTEAEEYMAKNPQVYAKYVKK